LTQGHAQPAVPCPATARVKAEGEGGKADFAREL
jgi:hypothetical protein